MHLAPPDCLVSPLLSLGEVAAPPPNPRSLIPDSLKLLKLKLFIKQSPCLKIVQSQQRSNDKIERWVVCLTLLLPPSFFSCSCFRPLELPPEKLSSSSFCKMGQDFLFWLEYKYRNHGLRIQIPIHKIYVRSTPPTWGWDLTGTGIVLPYLYPRGKTQPTTYPKSEI